MPSLRPFGPERFANKHDVADRPVIVDRHGACFEVRILGPFAVRVLDPHIVVVESAIPFDNRRAIKTAMFKAIILRRDSVGAEPIATAEIVAIEIDHPPHVQQPLIQSIVNDMNGVGECPSTGESGARTSWVMDQMLATYREKTAG